MSNSDPSFPEDAEPVASMMDERRLLELARDFASGSLPDSSWRVSPFAWRAPQALLPPPPALEVVEPAQEDDDSAVGDAWLEDTTEVEVSWPGVEVVPEVPATAPDTEPTVCDVVWSRSLLETTIDVRRPGKYILCDRPLVVFLQAIGLYLFSLMTIGLYVLAYAAVRALLLLS